MSIEVNVGITLGVEKLLEDRGSKFSLNQLKDMIKITVSLFNKSDFIVFKKNLLQTIVTDENNNLLAVAPFLIPEDICIVSEGGENNFVLMVILPSEIENEEEK
ncbi:hypothetical protein [Oceanobacillus oncorhynchi]|uniref:hypothetical protein n=1 Tax=Oceanobacillus oncorhynchi TaxID=545501 RepID=UPI0018686BC3|nr:hypothetical protein [Oceanobacillus oncorhynchi]